MRKTKVLVLAAMLAAPAMRAAAGQGVTFLFNDGHKESYLFSDNPKLQVSADGITVKFDASDTPASYQFNDIKNFHFADDITSGIEGVAVSAVGQPSNALFNYDGGAVSVTGLAAGERMTVATSGGAVIAVASANSEGCASVDLSGEAGGIYLVSAGGRAVKVIKK